MHVDHAEQVLYPFHLYAIEAEIVDLVDNLTYIKGNLRKETKLMSPGRYEPLPFWEVKGVKSLQKLGSGAKKTC